MPSFVPAILQRPVPHRVVRTLAEIHRSRGKQELYRERAPEVLENLRRVAVIESTESSNRIEGVIVPRSVLVELVEKEHKPPRIENRSEGEVAGYRAVLDLILASHQGIPVNSRVVLQLHRDLYKFAGGIGGHWKPTENEITEERADGSRFVRFVPVPAFRTPMAMDDLHSEFAAGLKAGEVDPLILIALYILDFLCIHPFADGNGRMSRLLSVLLLHQQGFEVGQYISLERLIEQAKEGYYDTLYRASQGWHESQHDPSPWIEYFLTIIRTAYEELGSRVEELKNQRGTKTAFVLQVIDRSVGDFSVADLHAKIPSVGLDLIRKVLKDEKAAGRVVPLGRGRAARWRKVAVSEGDELGTGR
jgi:Fic family protein